ncbi:MAG: pyrroline-5-carboxylate reductase dimerization domain-containing protein, partial [Candidatus Omnitrophota bacterium]
GTEMGMDKDKSEKLVIDTLAGAANLLKNMGVSPEELIKKVASKGGTTEAALKIFEEKKIGSAIKEAILNAKRRSEELSGG